MNGRGDIRSDDGFTAPCQTCHQVAVVCCGDATNGYWCARCCPSPYDVDGDFYGDDGDDDEQYFDCHMNIHGDCELAGTEECDWECPYSAVKRN